MATKLRAAQNMVTKKCSTKELDLAECLAKFKYDDHEHSACQSQENDLAECLAGVLCPEDDDVLKECLQQNGQRNCNNERKVVQDCMLEYIEAHRGL